MATTTAGDLPKSEHGPFVDLGMVVISFIAVSLVPNHYLTDVAPRDIEINTSSCPGTLPS